MEQSQSNQTQSTSVSSSETFDQKVIRNVQAGGFAVYKTPDVVGSQTLMANLEWEDPEQVDKFFAFAKSFGAKVIYVAERDEEDDAGNSKTSLAQVGFLHQGIMHHINLEEDDEDDEDEYVDDDHEEYDEEYDEEGDEYEDEEDGEYEEDHQEETPAPVQAPVQPTQQPIQQAPAQPVQQQQAPSSGQPQQPWPKPQY